MRVCVIGILWNQSESPGLICFNLFYPFFAADGDSDALGVFLGFQEIFSTEKRRAVFCRAPWPCCTRRTPRAAVPDTGCMGLPGAAGLSDKGPDQLKSGEYSPELLHTFMWPVKQAAIPN